MSETRKLEEVHIFLGGHVQRVEYTVRYLLRAKEFQYFSLLFQISLKSLTIGKTIFQTPRIVPTEIPSTLADL